MKESTPLVTVITVTFNSGSKLEGTIRSVLEQHYEYIEYLIVDGASSDQTLDVIKTWEAGNERQTQPKIFRWISEPDNGLYGAMNKALRMATGEFVLFLNAGDHFFSPETVGDLMQKAENSTDVIYGEVMLVDENRNHLGTRSELTTQKLPAELNWKSLQMGMVVCHQAFLVRRSLAPFYLANNLAADIDWVIEVLKKSSKTVNSGLVVAEFLTGGVSKQKHRLSLYDRFVILQKHFGFLPNLWNHLLIVLRSLFSRIGY